MIVYSAITIEAEVTHVNDHLIAGLAERSKAMQDIARRRRIPSFLALEGALIVGDSAFGTSNIMREIHEHGFRGAFRLADALQREVIGTRKVTRKRGAGDHLSVVLDVCQDGTHLCLCDAGKHPHERRAMLHTPAGSHAHVFVECENPACDLHATRFYVPFRKPDRVYADGRRELGEIDYSLVTPVWRALKDVEVVIFKGCQAIEHYHSQLLAKLGLGITDTSGRRKFSGDLRHRFYYALGDLIWNLTILFNLQDGFAHEKIDRDRLWEALLRNRRKIDRYSKNKPTDTADADATSEPPTKAKQKAPPPTYAVFRWRHASVAT